MDMQTKQDQLKLAIDSAFNEIRRIEQLAIEIHSQPIVLIQATFMRKGVSITTLETGLDKAIQSAVWEFRKATGSTIGFGDRIPDSCWGFIGTSPDVTEYQVRKDIEENNLRCCVQFRIS